jgi:hypothetical protein
VVGDEGQAKDASGSTGVAQETAVRQAETTDESAPAASSEKKPGIAAGIKAWSDAFLSVTKLIVLAGLVVLAVIVVRSELAQRRVMIDIDKNVEKLLFDLGADLDLRSALLEETNSRMEGVKSFLKANMFVRVSFEGPLALSLKPFGFDLSTSDVVTMARGVWGGQPPFRVRMNLFCVPGPCDTPQPAGMPSPRTFKRLILLVDIAGEKRTQRLSFSMSPQPAAMHRGLREAMQRTAERLLEQADPLLASVYYANVANAAAFASESRRYARLAAGMTFDVRAAASASQRCLGDVVFADSLVSRGHHELGIRGLSDVAKGASDDTTCRIYAQTDQIAFMYNLLCGSFTLKQSAAERQKLLKDAGIAMDELEDIQTTLLPEVERSRLAEFKAYSQFMNALFADDDDGLAAICGQGKPGAGSISSHERYGRVKSTLAAFAQSFPPRRRQQMPWVAANFVFSDIKGTIPDTDVNERFQSLAALRQSIEDYSKVDAKPGLIFLLQGQVLEELALTMLKAREVMTNPNRSTEEKESLLEQMYGAPVRLEYGVARLSDGMRAYLYEAQIAFEHAAAAINPFPSLEPSTDLEGTIYLGDVQYALEGVDQAEAAYANTIRLFIEHDEPLREFMLFAKAAARWAAVRAHDGACRTRPARLREWDAVWTRLGASSTHDWCALLDPPSGAADAGKPGLGLLGLIAPIIRDSVSRCGGAAGEPVARTASERLALIQCLARTGVDTPEVWTAFLSANTSAYIDEQIGHALDGN